MDIGALEWPYASDTVVLVAAAGATPAPETARSLGLRPPADDQRVSVYVPVPEGLALLSLIAESARIAVVVGRPRDYKSLQMKGVDAKISKTTPADEAWVSRYRSELGPLLEPTGVPPRLWDLMFSAEFVVVRFTPRQLSDQSPGPSAGLPLGGAE